MDDIHEKNVYTVGHYVRNLCWQKQPPWIEILTFVLVLPLTEHGKWAYL